jgi:hypothetical protein
MIRETVLLLSSPLRRTAYYGSRISLADQGNLGPQTQGTQIAAAHTPSGAQHTVVFLAPNCPARGR